MRIGRGAMGVLYLGAGACHLLFPRFYLAIMPDYLPMAPTLVLASGIAEMAGGAGVLVPHTRRAAAWGLVALLVCVFPANLWMAQHAGRYRPIPPWMLWARLPLQIPLLWWAWRTSRSGID